MSFRDPTLLVAKLKVVGNQQRSSLLRYLALVQPGFNTCPVLIVPYTQSLQHIKRLPPPCNLNNEQLCTMCSNPNKSKLLRDYFLRKFVLVVSAFPLYSQICLNPNLCEWLGLRMAYCSFGFFCLFQISSD